jgi:hypothetical protein
MAPAIEESIKNQELNEQEVNFQRGRRRRRRRGHGGPGSRHRVLYRLMGL